MIPLRVQKGSLKAIRVPSRVLLGFRAHRTIEGFKSSGDQSLGFWGVRVQALELEGLGFRV